MLFIVWVRSFSKMLHLT